MSKYPSIVTALALALGLGACGKTPSINHPSPTTSPTPVVFYYRTSAKQLWRLYHANEVAADNTLRDQFIVITGSITATNKDLWGNIILEFRTSNMFESVTAKLVESPEQAQQAAQIRNHTMVTVTCERVAFILGSPMARECVFGDTGAAAQAELTRIEANRQIELAAVRVEREQADAAEYARTHAVEIAAQAAQQQREQEQQAARLEALAAQEKVEAAERAKIHAAEVAARAAQQAIEDAQQTKVRAEQAKAQAAQQKLEDERLARSRAIEAHEAALNVARKLAEEGKSREAAANRRAALDSEPAYERATYVCQTQGMGHMCAGPRPMSLGRPYTPGVGPWAGYPHPVQ
jgi:hypothetical protein